jgi:hypothetical protein
MEVRLFDFAQDSPLERNKEIANWAAVTFLTPHRLGDRPKHALVTPTRQPEK